MKLSDLRSADEIHEQNMQDSEYRREYERTKLANDVAVRVLAYRTKHGMSQTELARKLGMRQPNIARLESGEHEPSLATLARLSLALGMDFSIDIKAGGLKLRQAPRSRKTARVAIVGAISGSSKHTARAVLATQSRRGGGWILAPRARARVGDAEAPKKAAGSGRSLPGRRPAPRLPSCHLPGPGRLISGPEVSPGVSPRAATDVSAGR